jgi:hypothetical protein
MYFRAQQPFRQPGTSSICGFPFISYFSYHNFSSVDCNLCKHGITLMTHAFAGSRVVSEITFSFQITYFCAAFCDILYSYSNVIVYLWELGTGASNLGFGES